MTKTCNLKNLLCNITVKDRMCPDKSKLCTCIHTLQFNVGDLVEMVIIDGGSMNQNHVAHLHGHWFTVIGTELVRVFLIILLNLRFNCDLKIIIKK